MWTDYKGLPTLLRRWAVLNWRDWTSAKPAGVLANAALTMSVAFGLRMIYRVIDRDGDGRISTEEARWFIQGGMWGLDPTHTPGASTAIHLEAGPNVP